MVENQIKSRGVTDSRVLEAMKKVPRHKFVPEGMKSVAYQDGPLPIGSGQTISQPYIVALMTELLDVRSDSKVLEIGTGSGYQAAILGELALSVITVERVQELFRDAKEILRELGYSNVTVINADGSIGYSEFSPYDRIIVTAASPDIPVSLKEQLADGGKMVIPVGSQFSQTLEVVKKEGKHIIKEESVGVRFVPLKGKEGW